MDLTQLGSIGEFVSAIAVVASLVYLSTQIRQNTRSMRAATFAQSTNGWQDYLLTQSVADLDLMLRANIDHETLSNAEFLRVYYLTRTMFRRIENDYYQALAGTFDQATWEGYQRAFREDTFNSPANRVFWDLQRTYFSAPFATYMDEFIAITPDEPLHLRQNFRQRLAG
jgi:hypothetical protein